MHFDLINYIYYYVGARVYSFGGRGLINMYKALDSMVTPK